MYQLDQFKHLVQTNVTVKAGQTPQDSINELII